MKLGFTVLVFLALSGGKLLYASEINPAWREIHYVGTIHMRPDGALVMNGTMTEHGEKPQEEHAVLMPGTGRYNYNLRKLGPLHPGETKHFDIWD